MSYSNQKKDLVEIDILVPINELRFELKPIAGRYTYYKMLVYQNSNLLVTQWEVGNWQRYCMQKIIQYFHPDDKMAKKVKL